MVTQHPWVGNSVNPRMETAKGTSELQGKAPVTTKLHIWHWTSTQEPQSPKSIAGPQQQQGRRSAPGLQQISAWQQQHPTLPEQLIFIWSKVRKKVALARWNRRYVALYKIDNRFSFLFSKFLPNAIGSLVKATVDATQGTAQSDLALVNGVVRHVWDWTCQTKRNRRNEIVKPLKTVPDCWVPDLQPRDPTRIF